MSLPVAELRQLKELLDEGLLTEDEFTAKKKQLLGLDAAPSAPTPSAPAPLAARHADAARSLILGACEQGGVLVTGDTLGNKAHLKAVGGATWEARLEAWRFRDKTVAELRAELEKRGVAVDEDTAEGDAVARREARLQGVKGATLARAAAAQAHAHVRVSRHKRAVLVTGDTKQLVDALRALGGKWIRTLGGWCLPGSARVELLSALRADSTNVVTEESDAPTSGAAASAHGSRTKPSKRKRGQHEVPDAVCEGDGGCVDGGEAEGADEDFDFEHE